MVSLHRDVEPNNVGALTPRRRQRDDRFGPPISLRDCGQRLGFARPRLLRIDSRDITGIPQRQHQVAGPGRPLRPGGTPCVGIVPQDEVRPVFVYRHNDNSPIAAFDGGLPATLCGTLAAAFSGALAASFGRRAFGDPHQAPHLGRSEVEGNVGNITHCGHSFVCHLETGNHVGERLVVELWRFAGFRRAG